MASEPRIGFVCAIGWEQPLIDELTAVASGAEAFAAAPGFVTARRVPSLMRCDTVFARNRLPDIVRISADGARDLARLAGEAADVMLDAVALNWTAGFTTPDAWTCESEAYADIHARASLVSDLFDERMRTYRKRANERRRPWQEIAETGRGIVVTGLLTKKDEVWLSVAQLGRDAAGIMVPAPWPSPDVLIGHDPVAPCRSYYKLEEAWLEAGTAPKRGQTCVDIGAAPGGWTWSALRRGARVTAVDAADLDRRVAAEKNCEHRRDNGYEFMPEQTVDWLLCDMIVRPMATLGLVERWLEAGLCRGFVVNVKFRGKDPSSILDAIERLEKRFSLERLRVKHLFHDRNEITLICPPDTGGRQPKRRR